MRKLLLATTVLGFTASAAIAQHPSPTITHFPSIYDTTIDTIAPWAPPIHQNLGGSNRGHVLMWADQQTDQVGDHITLTTHDASGAPYVFFHDSVITDGDQIGFQILLDNVPYTAYIPIVTGDTIVTMTMKQAAMLGGGASYFTNSKLPNAVGTGDIVSPGAGYVVGNVISPTDGTCRIVPAFKVDAVDGSGGITALEITTSPGNRWGGYCTAAPSASTAMTGGSGSGAIVKVTYGNMAFTTALAAYHSPGDVDGAGYQPNAGILVSVPGRVAFNLPVGPNNKIFVCDATQTGGPQPPFSACPTASPTEVIQLDTTTVGLGNGPFITLARSVAGLWPAYHDVYGQIYFSVPSTSSGSIDTNIAQIGMLQNGVMNVLVSGSTGAGQTDSVAIIASNLNRTVTVSIPQNTSAITAAGLIVAAVKADPVLGIYTTAATSSGATVMLTTASAIRFDSTSGTHFTLTNRFFPMGLLQIGTADGNGGHKALPEIRVRKGTWTPSDGSNTCTPAAFSVIGSTGAGQTDTVLITATNEGDDPEVVTFQTETVTINIPQNTSASTAAGLMVTAINADAILSAAGFAATNNGAIVTITNTTQSATWSFTDGAHITIDDEAASMGDPGFGNIMTCQLSALKGITIGASQLQGNLLNIRGRKNGAVSMAVKNSSTESGATSVFSLFTGTTDSQFTVRLNDNAGTPTLSFLSGAGVVHSFMEGPDFHFRALSASTDWVLIDSNGVKIPVVTTGTATAFACLTSTGQIISKGSACLP